MAFYRDLGQNLDSHSSLELPAWNDVSGGGSVDRLDELANTGVIDIDEACAKRRRQRTPSISMAPGRASSSNRSTLSRARYVVPTCWTFKTFSSRTNSSSAATPLWCRRSMIRRNAVFGTNSTKPTNEGLRLSAMSAHNPSIHHLEVVRGISLIYNSLISILDP